MLKVWDLFLLCRPSRGGCQGPWAKVTGRFSYKASLVLVRNPFSAFSTEGSVSVALSWLFCIPCKPLTLVSQPKCDSAATIKGSRAPGLAQLLFSVLLLRPCPGCCHSMSDNHTGVPDLLPPWPLSGWGPFPRPLPAHYDRLRGRRASQVKKTRELRSTTESRKWKNQEDSAQQRASVREPPPGQDNTLQPAWPQAPVIAQHSPHVAFM